MRQPVLALALCACPALIATAAATSALGPVPPLICASGSAISTVDLRVTSPSQQHQNEPLPLRTMNLIEEGDVIHYKPLLRPHEERKGDITLVLIPANKKAARTSLKVFDSRPASQATQWDVPWRTALVAFIYGPSGLSVKKVESLLQTDDGLVGELADYADKTEKAEALISALTTPGNSPAAVNAALQGFSSKFGTNVQLTKDGSLNQNASVLLQSFNPSIAAFDPLAPQTGQSVGQTAGIAAMVGEIFLGSPVGLAAGGTAMLLDLGEIAFPHSEFRSAFSQAMPGDALGLCGRGGSAPHTRVQYIWATRIPDAAKPRLTVGKENSLPIAVKSPLPLTVAKAPETKAPLLAPSDPSKAPLAAAEDDWKYLSRARNWMLQPEGGKPIPVKVQVLANTKSIELDLAKDLKPGRYGLAAGWDWDQFQVVGEFDARPLADFASAKLTPDSHDKLVANTGRFPLTLQGADFEFITKVEIKKLNDEFASASAIPFVLPKGLRAGVQDRMDIQIDTGGMDTGAYKLMLSQVDGKAHDVPLKLLPPMPVISNLPVTLNQGSTSLSVDLKGSGLQSLQSLKLSKGTATLGPASGDGTVRTATFQLPPLSAGASISMEATVADRSHPLTIAEAIDVVAPRPVITDVRVSQLPNQAVHLNDGELPGGLLLTAMLHVANLPASSGVKLECEKSQSGAISLRPGQAAGGSKLEQLTSDQLFLTFDTSAWSSGCEVQATVTSGLGDSIPRHIARIVNVPSVDEIDLTPDVILGQVRATLVGRKLETIAKTGWLPDQGMSVADLPQPLSDGRQRLEVRVTVPPSPGAALYIWLHGDSKPRLTTVHATPF